MCVRIFVFMFFSTFKSLEIFFTSFVIIFEYVGQPFLYKVQGTQNNIKLKKKVSVEKSNTNPSIQNKIIGPISYPLRHR